MTLVRGPIVFAEGSFNNEATPAIGFAYIAGYIMRHGYKVEIVDSISEGLNQVFPIKSHPGFKGHGISLEDIVKKIPDDTDVIGFSGMFSGEWPVIRELIYMVRERFPKKLIVAGGEHVTALAEFSLNECTALDAVVRGEGEHTFYELLEKFRETGNLEGVNGISYLDETSTYIENGGLPRIRDVDDIPWPYWPDGYLEKFWKAGKSHGVLTERDMPMMASRGCPYQCTFCSSAQMWTTKYSLRTPDDVLDEIEHYIERYDITSVQLYDLTAITKKKWIVEFCGKMLERKINIKWSLPAGTRSEALDQQTLSLVKETGCHYLVYAAESGSQATLDLIKKRISLDRITESMKIAKDVGLTLRSNLIIGFPHEMRSDVYLTLRYGLYLSWMGVDEVALFIYSGYPGTAIFNELLEAGNITLSDEYFLSMQSLNSKFSSLEHKTYNEHIHPRELAFYRTLFLALNYIVGYIRYPKRIIRTIKNVFGDNEAATVLEHRLRDALSRRHEAS
ncbi:B12-binding domain-containing radical SAM protein [Rhodospirillales bacterium]|nr:B12-binding domain-containing radical SAM protein [Rhodospirillales bacterium]